MRRAAMDVVFARFLQTQLAVHSQPHVTGIAVFLAVVLPPAHRAKSQHTRCLKRSASAAWAAILCHNNFHDQMDAIHPSNDYIQFTFAAQSAPAIRLSQVQNQEFRFIWQQFLATTKKLQELKAES
jgi:hypothetical protein